MRNIDYSLLVRSHERRAQECLAEAATNLEFLLAEDIRTLDGRSLAKLRDDILKWHSLCAFQSPVGRQLIERKAARVHRTLSVDETLAIIAPLLAPKVTFSIER